MRGKPFFVKTGFPRTPFKKSNRADGTRSITQLQKSISMHEFFIRIRIKALTKIRIRVIIIEVKIKKRKVSHHEKSI